MERTPLPGKVPPNRRIWFAWVLVRSAVLVAGCEAHPSSTPEEVAPPPAVTVSVSPDTGKSARGRHIHIQAT